MVILPFLCCVSIAIIFKGKFYRITIRPAIQEATHAQNEWSRDLGERMMIKGSRCLDPLLAWIDEI